MTNNFPQFIGIHLDGDLKYRLTELARNQGLPLAPMVRAVLEQYLDEQEESPS